MNTVEENVLKCIKKDGECMGNYERLDLVYWTEIDKVMIHDIKTDTFMVKGFNIHRLTSTETINRAFRNLVKHKAMLARKEDEF
jgi:hypothetical protein